MRENYKKRSNYTLTTFFVICRKLLITCCKKIYEALVTKGVFELLKIKSNG